MLIGSSWGWILGRGDDDNASGSMKEVCLEMDTTVCLFVWYAEILFPLPSNITGSSSASGTHFSPRIMVFIQTESSAFNLGPFTFSSFTSQFLATDKLLGIFMLKLNGTLRSEVTLFILSEIKGSTGICCNAGGRGNSFSFSFSFSLLSFSSVFDVCEVSDSLDNSAGSRVGGGGDDFLPNLPLHKAVIMAMLAAKPAAKNDRYITGWCMNARFSIGSLLPMTCKNNVCYCLLFLFTEQLWTVLWGLSFWMKKSWEKIQFQKSNTKFWGFFGILLEFRGKEKIEIRRPNRRCVFFYTFYFFYFWKIWQHCCCLSKPKNITMLHWILLLSSQ